MKRFFAYILTACFLFGAVSCEKTPEPDNDKPSGSVTLKDVNLTTVVAETSATTATLEYSLNRDAVSSMPIEVMLRYSVSESFPTDDTEVIRLKKDQTSVTLSGLQFDRQYYYEAFLTLYGTEYNAERSSFKTKSVSIAMNEPSESSGGLTVSGKVNGISGADLPEFDAKLYLTDLAVGVVDEHRLELAEDFTFSKAIDGLDIGSAYSYSVQVSQGTQEPVTSDEKTFVTSDPYVAAEKTIAGAATDLSADGTSNCYIVSSSGVYKFRLVKGNSDEPVGDVRSVRILWESFGTAVKPAALDLISATCKEGDYAVFDVPDFKEGNAVIAVYDSQDNILWSWHIWLTAAQMTEITYANEAGIMMDRNLGALTATPNDAKALGLFYQWGRKDPFLGSSSISQPLYAKSSRNLKEVANTSETATVAYALANPHKFILANKGGDWLASKDNSLWGSTKTIYDPCPAGWRVPDGGYDGGYESGGLANGIWAKAGLPREGATEFGPEDNGKLGKVLGSPFCTPQTWYPAAGSINYADGSIYALGVDGIYHSVTAFGGSDTMVTGFLFNYLPNINVHNIYCGGEKFARAGGNSVRCCKE